MSAEDVDHDLLSIEFHALYRDHHIKKTEKRKKEKPTKVKLGKSTSRLTVEDVSVVPKVQLLGNPSDFAVYCTVRSRVLEHNFAESCRKLMQTEETDDETDCPIETLSPVRLPKIIGLGIETVFQIIQESHKECPRICIKALEALLNILQGQQPQSLKKESTSVLDSIFSVLLQLSNCESSEVMGTSTGAQKSDYLTSLATSCLISLAVARGDTKQLLQTILCLFKCDEAYVFQELKNPDILKSLQFSIFSILAGRQSLPQWLCHGIPSSESVDTFQVEFSNEGDGNVGKSITSDGLYIYLLCLDGLYKIGTGCFGTVKGHIYVKNKYPTSRENPGWLGWSNEKLYCRITKPDTKELVMDIIDTETLEVSSACAFNTWVDGDEDASSYTFFTDGSNLSYITPTPSDGFLFRTLSNDAFDTNIFTNEFKIRLVKKSVEVCGPGSWDSETELREVDTGYDEEVVEITAGKDFTILRTTNGRLLYYGKSASLGQKVGLSKCGKWGELNLGKSTGFIQCAVGHEGIHGILLAEDGTAFFVGTPKRGEDGDLGKPRRVAKASKPKKVTRMDGHEVGFVACNNGTSAFVTRSGELYMFGKDASFSHCDQNGHVSSLRGVTVSQIAMGKAHSVILTTEGMVYTMGVNNKGQCGRAVPNQRDDDPLDEEDAEWEEIRGCAENGEEVGEDGVCLPGQHRWKHDQCMVCTVCRECTGYGSACISALRPDRNPGQECGCGVGDAGCEWCGSCRACAREGDDGDFVLLQGGLVAPDAYHVPNIVEHGQDGNEENVPDVEDRENRRRFPQVGRLKMKEKERVSGSRDSGMVSFSALVRLNLGSSRIIQVASGLHHTVLLDSTGKVLVCGNNNFGQLGLGDKSCRFSPVRVTFQIDVEIVQIAAGSYHTVCLDSQGIVYTAGLNTKEQLGRTEVDGDSETSILKMVQIEGLGSRFGRRVTWIGASGDSTFLTLEASLISPAALKQSSITANKSAILIMRGWRKEERGWWILINRRDGTCQEGIGEREWENQRIVAVLDPVYHFLWAYDSLCKNIQCYNSKASEITSPEIPSNLRLLKPPHALPFAKGSTLHRWQAGGNLLACMETLVSTRIQGLSVCLEEEEIPSTRTKSFTRDDYLNVCRFENNGGGWGYSSNCSEAVRFSCDADLLLGGYGLYGGRGEYTANIKLFDIGLHGGEVEADGELIAQADDITYDTVARQKFRIMFDEPVTIHAGRWYVAWALITGPASDCGSNGQSTVLTDDHILFQFKSSKKSTNGTDVNSGQLPQILYRTIHSEESSLGLEPKDSEPIHVLSQDFLSIFSPASISILTSLFEWSKRELVKVVSFVHNSPQNQFKFDFLKFVARMCLRLVEYSTKQAYPLKGLGCGRPGQTESLAMAEAIGDVRSLLQKMITITTDSSELNTSDIEDIMDQASNTYINCFKVFYPTSFLKWESLKSVTHVVISKGGGYLRLFMCTVWALWRCKGQLMSIFPVLRNHAHEVSDETNLVFVTNTEWGKLKTPQKNRILIAQMTGRLESENFLRRTGWDFWKTLRHILTILRLAEEREKTDEMAKAVLLHSSILIARLMEELVSHASGTYSELESVIGQVILSTPCRFARTNQSRTWNTGMGSADAVGFFVDQEGVSVFGACIYSGVGTYSYVLELLHEIEESEGGDEKAPNWVTLESVTGTFDAEDCVGDVAEVRFSRPVHIKASRKYALRLQNQGGKTCNGDGGVSVLHCADGTTFTFSACPLSYNGTNQIRGQIPYILYFRNPDDSDARQKSKVIAEMEARKSGLKLCKCIFEDAKTRLMSTLEQMKNEEVEVEVGNSIFTTIFLPSFISHLQKLGRSDPRSSVELLVLIREILPIISQMNQTLEKRKSGEMKKEERNSKAHYAWVESPHPYKPASLSQYKVNFPSSVKEMTIEFDPRCITAQEEDVLRIFVPFENEHSKWIDKDIEFEYSPHVAAMEKSYSNINWPDKAIVLPGNEILFSMETSSDYVRGEKRDYYGFRCLVTGYENRQSNGIQHVELELSYLAGFCTHELLKKNLLLPPVSVEELEVEEGKLSEELASAICMKHQTLFSKGIGLEYFPSVQEAIDGIVPLRENSKEREFVADFIARTPNTSGERLANWLQPESFVDPQKCEMIFPVEKLRRGKPAVLNFLIRDQYGDTVVSPNLEVEMKARQVQRNHNSSKSCPYNRFPQKSNSSRSSQESIKIPEIPYEPTLKEKTRYQAITMMKEYENFSFEEIRLFYPIGRRTSESMLIRQNNNGACSVTWTPLYTGSYNISITVDGYAIPQIPIVEVEEAPEGPTAFRKVAETDCPTTLNYSNKRKFEARGTESSGLRIRDHPTLQSEQLGLIPINGILTFVQETHNDDGIWVKLDEPSFREYCRNANAFQREGWCLQFNQHLGKTFLFPLEPPKALPGLQTDTTVRKATDTLASNPENSNSSKALRLNGGSDMYVVVQCGASGHNIRTRPNLRSPPVGILALGTKFYAVDECYNGDGTWLKLDNESQRRHCFTKDGEPWSLAVGLGDIVYLRKCEKEGVGGEEPPGYDFSMASQVPQSVFQSSMSPLAFGSLDFLPKDTVPQLQAPQPFYQSESEGETKALQLPPPIPKVSKRVNSSDGEVGKGTGRSRSSTTFGALQKWLQMGTESLGGSHSGASSSKSSHSMLEASKSFVKEGIHALSTTSKPVPSVGIFSNSATQTSPDPHLQSLSLPFPQVIQFHIGASHDLSLYLPKDIQKGRLSEKRKSRSLSRGGVRDPKPSKSPRPSTQEPQHSSGLTPGGVKVKEAVGPGDAQSVRAVFGVVLWYAGIIHDAMASASYLKFLQSSDEENVSSRASSNTHSIDTELPKRKAKKSNSEAQVVIRKKTFCGTVKPPSQRHSVEASSSPWLLKINPMQDQEVNFLSKILRNGVEKEEDGGHVEDPTLNPQSKPPPALAALQSIWAHIKKSCSEALLQEMFRGLRYKIDGPIKFGPIKSKKERKVSGQKSRKEKAKKVEALGRSFLIDDEPHEDTYDDPEFTLTHQCEVCKVRFSRRGKSRKSYFGFSSLCENCVECQMKLRREDVTHQMPISAQGGRDTDYTLGNNSSSSNNVHTSILNNALFLLQIINNPAEGCRLKEMERGVLGVGNSFSCYEALGIRESELDRKEDSETISELKFMETEGMTGEEKVALDTIITSPNPLHPMDVRIFPSDTQPRRRKTSNGDPSSGNGRESGENLLNRPSPALQKYLENSVTEGETEALVKLCGHIVSFVVEKHDLPRLRLYLFQAIRKVTCRSYGMGMLAWLLRNVSQPTALHDLFWWYASSIEPKHNQSDLLQEDVDNGWWEMRNHPLADSPSLIFPILSESFYVLLETMSDIMRFLPIGSPLLEMAVKCWGVSFSRKDHRFLHKCKIFRNLSKIMSQFDGDNEWSKSSVSLEAGDVENEGSVELMSCLEDLTPTADIKVSSRTALVSSLRDESTETFWESGDEDRNRTKHILIINNSEGEIKLGAIYLDNVKDNLCRVSSISLKAGPRPEELEMFGLVDVDPKFIGWIWFPIRAPTAKVIRFDLKSGDTNVRVRQVKLLGSMAESFDPIDKTLTAPLIPRQKCERETLRIFRLLSSEVFGKLLSERKQGEDDEGNDLQEHVVGILFSRNKLTYLQKQVCSHVVAAIHRETMKIKEEFDLNMVGTILEITEESIKLVSGDRPRVGDRYCFEMLSLVLALAGSKVGRSYLSQQSNLIQDLIQLLHAGTPRIQRQVLHVIRKIFSEIKPEEFSQILIGNHGVGRSNRNFSTLDLFLGIISKSLQMKGRTTGTTERSRVARTINIADTLHPDEFPYNYWFLHGEVETQLANAVVRLIKDMTEGLFSKDWEVVSKKAIADSIMYIPTIPLDMRNLDCCLSSADFWLSVASLCVLHEDHVELLSYPAYKNGSSARATCCNHDDGETVAVIQCCVCGDLCADCDRILHLPKKNWDHVRKICKEEEESINVDLHEGCGRIKLFWLMALADSSTLKTLVEFRQGIPKVTEKDLSPIQTVGRCRFCGCSGNSGPLALGNVCADPECQEFSKTACENILPCSHLCGGVKGEAVCLPCLQQCDQTDKLKQDGEDMCMICFTDALAYAPAIQLECGHVYHYHCCRAVLEKKWAGPRITFTFSSCPVCKIEMKHDLLEELLGPIRELCGDVKRKALMRLEYEGMSQIDAIASPGGQYFQNPGQYAIDRYAYYLCFKCKKAYFGGDARCDVEIQTEFDPAELVCGGCSDISQAQLCPKHGTDYLEYKCRYCCSVAVFFCFGTTHFCNGCHDDFQRVTSIPKAQLPSCPVGPRAKQLEVEECPLHVSHPPTGEEFALGCGVCRNAHTF